MAAVGRDQDAVGAFEFRLTEDTHDLAWGVDAIDGFFAEFHGIAIAVAGVSEIDATPGVEDEVVRGVELFAFKLRGEDGEGPVFFGAGDTAAAGFTDEDTAFGIDKRAVGAGCVGAE